jgi:hypothetical protein
MQEYYFIVFAARWQYLQQAVLAFRTDYHNQYLHSGQTRVTCDSQFLRSGQTSVTCDSQFPRSGQTSVICDSQFPRSGQTSVTCDNRQLLMRFTGSTFWKEQSKKNFRILIDAIDRRKQVAVTVRINLYNT